MKKILFGLFVALVAISITAPSPVFAAPDLNETLDTVKNIYTFNGTIHSAVTDGETLYLGGGFSSVSVPTGEAVLFNEATEEMQTFPRVETQEIPGTVYATISDGDGGWYIAGDFNSVGDEEVGGVAHILSDGSLDINFLPTLDAGTGSALALSSDGGTLYVGGNLLTVNGGTVRRYVAAFDTSDGSVLAFNPLEEAFLAGATALVLSPDDTVLYVASSGWEGGCSLFSFDTSTGNPTDLFDCGSVGGAVYTLALSEDGNTLYAGGSFANVNDGVTLRNNIAAFDTTTGIATLFDPDVSGDVRSLVLNSDGSVLYAGGSFGLVGGEVRNEFAAIDTGTGLVTALDAGVAGGQNSVLAIGLSTDGETIYLGGRDFTEVGGQPRQYFAEIDADTGLATSFSPDLNNRVYAIAVADGEVLVGGSFTAKSVTGRSEVAAIDLTTYELTDFDPDVVPYADDTTYALALSPDGETLYIGGSISGVNGGDALRNMLAAVDTTTGLATEFDPGLDGPVNALTVSPDGTTVYAGGAFQSVNDGGVIQPYLAAFDAVTGIADEAFAPIVDNSVNSVVLSPDGQTLYVGGDFTGRVLALDVATGETLVTPGAPPNSAVYALDLSSDGTTLYVGGTFTSFDPDSIAVGEGFIADANTGALVDSSNILSTNQSTVHVSIPDGNGGWYVGGTFNRINGEAWGSRIIHILSDNTVDTNFEPDFGGESGVVYALALDDDGTLYAGGQFFNLGLEERVGLAAFDTSDGSLLPFDPSLGVYGDGALVRALELDGNGTLYVGGKFTCVGYDYDLVQCPEGSTRNNLAAIDTTTGLATAFDPNISGVTGVYDIDISTDGTVLYVGGGFTQVNGDQSRTDFAAFSLAPETLGDVTVLDPGIAGSPETVHAIAESSDGNTVYVGGDFYTVVGLFAEYTILAAVDVEADGGVGALSETFPVVLSDSGEIVHTLALSPDDGTLYVGGYLDANDRGIFALSTQDGSVVDGFDAQLDDYYTVYTIGTPQNGEIFIGGESMYLLGEGGGTRQGLAALDATDLSLTEFNPSVAGLGVYSIVLSSDDELIYVGGTQEGGTYLTSFTTDGTEAAFSPELQFEMSGYVYALALSPEDDELYAAGTGLEGNYAIFSSDEVAPPADGDDDDGDDESGGGTSFRRTASGISSSVEDSVVRKIMEQLILLLQQLIVQLIAEQQN